MFGISIFQTPIEPSYGYRMKAEVSGDFVGALN